MTNTKHIAMFAIMAGAIFSLGIAPLMSSAEALNNNTTMKQEERTVVNGVGVHAEETADCGYLGDCSMYFKIYDSSNKVKVYYKVEDETCDITITVEDEAGTEVGNWSRDNFSGGYSYVSFNTGVSGNSPEDRFEATTEFICQ